MPARAKEKTLQTEARIREAAHAVFLKKGFAAATVRDVAKQAGSNLALVNYYFRSKKALFEVIMKEKVQQVIGSLRPILTDETTTLDEKIERIVNFYIDFLIKNPDLPVFIMSEARKKNFELVTRARIDKIVGQSQFMKQVKEQNGDVDPAHFFVSLWGLIIFPFVAKPMMIQTRLVNDKGFQKMMLERKKFIPIWARSILSIKN
jgi:AcrR family transcriptional regulator